MEVNNDIYSLNVLHPAKCRLYQFVALTIINMLGKSEIHRAAKEKQGKERQKKE
jgi:hypothetical protein